MPLMVLLFAVDVKAQIPFSLQDRAFLQSTSPLRKDLAGYWRLEESSGTRYDFSKNGNHLTSNNSVGQAAGVSAYTGNAATFARASAQYLSIASQASVNFGIGQPFTLQVWAYMASKPAASAVVIGKSLDPSNNQYAIVWDQPSDRFVFLCSSNGTAFNLVLTASTFGAPTTSTWYHLLAKWDGTTAHLGVNGVSNTVAYANGAKSGTAQFEVGRYNNTATRCWDGRIDEVGIWGRALSTAEIIQLYNAGLGTHFPWAHP